MWLVIGASKSPPWLYFFEFIIGIGTRPVSFLGIGTVLISFASPLMCPQGKWLARGHTEEEEQTVPVGADPSSKPPELSHQEAVTAQSQS